MAEARIEVLRAGPATTVQDQGRYGLRRYGVNVSGPMDWVAHGTALALAGAPQDAPAFETGPGGLEIAALGGPVHVGVAGTGSGGVWARGAGARTVLPAPFALVLAPGERLFVRAGARGTWTSLAVAGLDAGAPVLRSRATNARTGLGPVRPVAGACYGCAAADAAPLFLARDPLGDEEASARIEVLPGPQHHLFEPDIQARLTEGTYEVTDQRDRMGMALAGDPLPCAAGHDIVSDAMVEGAMQIPGNGRPLVLCADRAPTGGYPKLAIVARASLPRLVQARPGDRLRFVWSDITAARAATAALRAATVAPAARARAPLDPAFLRAFAADLR